ncbi:ribosomal protein S18-alanine N-acetyltransferase [Gluconobacter morbifer]|nr:ribosomal protein S18-alanine N-acetyltransferase [Gluconobacter morbifer]
MGLESARVLAALHARAFAGGEVWDEASFVSLLSTPYTEAVIALDEDDPVGFVLCRTIADETEILTIAVDPARQGRGTGTLLVKSVLEKSRVFLEVSECNKKARALYERCGFVKAGLRRAYYRDGSDALVLVSSV